MMMRRVGTSRCEVGSTAASVALGCVSSQSQGPPLDYEIEASGATLYVIRWIATEVRRKRRDCMSTPKTNVPNQAVLRKRLELADRLGSAGAAIGVILVALGLILQEYFDGIGTAIRTLGGVLLLCGFAAVVFGESRRRAVVFGAWRRIGARYMAVTARWGWPDRVGLAGVAIGAALVAPALVLQIIFGNSLVVIVPAVILFWSGVGLLIYGRFHGRDTRRTRPLPPSSSPSRREGRGKSPGGR